MNRLAFVFCILLLAGCGSAPEWPSTGFPYRAPAGCFTVYSEVPIAQGFLDDTFSRLNRILTPVLQDVCSYRLVPAYVLNTPYWEIGGVTYDGFYDAFAGITLAQGMRAWVHELLHARDTTNFCPGTVFHENWENNGYNELSDEFDRDMPWEPEY